MHELSEADASNHPHVLGLRNEKRNSRTYYQRHCRTGSLVGDVLDNHGIYPPL